MEVYKLVKNKETGTFHIIKAPVNNFNQIIERSANLIYGHSPEKVNEFNLLDFNYYIQELGFNVLNYGNIEIIREATAILANKGYNICGNCVKELYKNNYPDMN